MKKLKKIATMAMAFGIAGATAFGFVGCNIKENNVTPEPEEPIIIPGEDEPGIDPENPPIDDNREDPPIDDNREDPPIDEEKAFEDAVAWMNEFFDSWAEAKNFTYTVSADNNPENYETCYFDEDVVKVDDCGIVAYYSLENGVNYAYTLEEDGSWHKNKTEQLDSLTVIEMLVAQFNGIKWKDYDVDTKILSGTYTDTSLNVDMSLNAKLDSDGKFSMQSIQNGETEETKNYTIYDVGTTVVALPENVIDDTAEKLYDAQGNLNSTLLAQAIVEWLNESGYYKNVVAKATGKYVTFDKIDFIDLDEENKRVEFGVYNVDTATGSPVKKHMSLVTYYQPFADKLLNGDFKNYTYDDFKNYLNENYSNNPLNQKGSNETLESYTLDDEMTEQERNDMFTMAENILTRLAEVGYQGSSIKNEGVKITDYVGASILSVRKDKDVSQGSGLDMGTVSSADFYITIIKTNGTKEILTLGLSYVTNGLSQNVLENTKEDSWIIRNFSSKEIDYCPYTENYATAQNEITK